VVEVVPDDEIGQLSVEALRQMADERVRLVAVTHVPTNGGLVNPAAEIGAIAREIGCDLLSVTGRKFLRGPRGTGLLYVRRSILDQLEPPLLDLHAAEWVAPDRYVMRDDARRFENWETNVSAKLGLGAAIDYALGSGLEPIWARVSALADLLRERLDDYQAWLCAIRALCAVASSASPWRARIWRRCAMLCVCGTSTSLSRRASTRLLIWRRVVCPVWYAPRPTTTTRRKKPHISVWRWQTCCPDRV
jgi:selenocysteine lyase/cysteine desulfurase